MVFQGMNALLSQTRFPRAWLLAQRLIGGTPDKQRLALQHYSGQRRILEIGCSVGNIADVFRDKGDIHYTGVDIDEPALSVARDRFAGDDRFVFTNAPLDDFIAQAMQWDYVLIAGVLHHVDEDDARKMVRDCAALTAPGGCLVVSEPVPLRPNDGLAFKVIHKVEQGQFLRETDALAAMVDATDLTIVDRLEPQIGPGFSPRPKMMRFALLKAVPAAPDTV